MFGNLILLVGSVVSSDPLDLAFNVAFASVNRFVDSTVSAHIAASVKVSKSSLFKSISYVIIVTRTIVTLKINDSRPFLTLIHRITHVASSPIMVVIALVPIFRLLFPFQCRAVVERGLGSGEPQRALIRNY